MQVVTEPYGPHLAKRVALHQELIRELADVRSKKQLLKHPWFMANREVVRKILRTPEVFPIPRELPMEAKETVRVGAWNIERGAAYKPIVETLRTHPILSQCDVLLLQETDFGMARSENRHVAKDLGQDVNRHAAFGPEYIHFEIGNGKERLRIKGENTIALEGNSILSRYPMKDVELIPLPHPKDQVASREKRIGAQSALAATIETPQGDLHVVSVHLSAHSSRGLRRKQITKIAQTMARRKGPCILGGDWNTTTYHANHALLQFLGFWRRVAMGVKYVMVNHYAHPERYFERRLFRNLEKHGFDTKACNVPGACTMHHNFEDPSTTDMLRDIIPNWCLEIVKWSLKDFEGRTSMKVDWFAAREMETQTPRVIYDLPHEDGRLSDHDPIVVDAKL